MLNFLFIGETSDLFVSMRNCYTWAHTTEIEVFMVVYGIYDVQMG